MRWFKGLGFNAYWALPKKEAVMEKKKTKFEEALAVILKHEGGYVNDPDDLGGETNFGITRKTAEEHGYHGDMKSVPMDLVADIYRRSYWDKQKCGVFAVRSYDVALELFDAGVNAGTKRSSKWLQEAVSMWSGERLVVDGAIGKVTLAALSLIKDRDLPRVVHIQKYLRTKHYFSIAKSRPQNAKFLKGWIKRVASK